MIRDSINGYRENSNKIVQIKDTPLTSTEKPKSFDIGCDYIRSYDSLKSPKPLLEEILGVSSTYCQSFKECAIDNGYFLYDEITKPIICFICLVYFKYNSNILTNINNTKSDPIKIKQWLKEIGINDIIIKKIQNNYIQQVVIQNRKIIFPDKHSPIKLNKLNQRNLISQPFRYTNKTQQLKPNELCINDHPEGHCLALTTWFLVKNAEYYEYSNSTRQKFKNRYLVDLKRVTNSRVIGGIHSIIDKKVQNNILKFRNNTYLPFDFDYIQDVYSSNSKLHFDISKILNLMEVNKLTKLFAQIITHDHAMGISFILKGSLIKVLVYDPNDKKSYRSIIIDPELNNYTNLCDFFTTIPYFKQENDTIAILLRCYAYNTPKFFIKIDNELNKLSNNANQLLRLGILTCNSDLIIKSIEDGANDYYSLIIAVQFQPPMEIIKLVLKLLPESINYIETKVKYTALCYAVEQQEIKIIELLLLSGAKIKVDGAKSPLNLINNNQLIFNMLQKSI